jgi:hypothetical protein
VHTLASIFLLAAETAEEHAEPSKTPFYVAGGVLAAWAVVVSAIGITQPEFPRTAGMTRGVYLISAVLMIGAMATAITTS